ncbi:hypothetical protein RRG08_065721 [Elysia crispata]|uniref:Uncharacterized protein n=1 Tax=Elysia crispata TaxID=231223 RepID=A0AAE1DAX4_9GAST|nr:hypothetical protein RRG08_065721 [Elysia crispata]
MAASVSAESQLAKRKMARHHIDILIWPLPPRTKPPVTTGITIGLVSFDSYRSRVTGVSLLQPYTLTHLYGCTHEYATYGVM